MPIYAYRCAACGHAKDILQKLSDAPLTQCPVCGEARFEKQVTAAGFQLKGSGWYVTDFRDGGAKKAADKQPAEAAAASKDGSKPAAETGAVASAAAPAPAAAAPAPGGAPAAAAPPPASTSS
jgi:putative FmdB family regulatory protein